MSHVVPSVPFPHYSLRFPLAEAFPELKAMEGWGQDATRLLYGALRHHQCARWIGVCVCVWICSWDCICAARGRQGGKNLLPWACPARVGPATVPGSLSRP